MKKNLLLIIFIISIIPIYSQSYYVAGDFQGWNPSSTIMYDDGTNGDATSGDGIYSVELSIATSGEHGWKVTDGTWDNQWPSTVGSKECWFYTTSEPEVVLFTFNTNSMGDSWLPDQNILGTNETKPSNLVAIGDWQSEAGESGDWVNNSSITVMYDDGTNGDWQADDGIYCYHMNTLPVGSYQVRGVMSGSWYGWGTEGRSKDGTNISFSTTVANQDVYVYTDVNTGRTILTLDDPLPVELTSFNSIVKKNSILLEWTTATELNNYGFEIEKKSQNTEWTKIAFVQGSGNSNTPQKYTYTDFGIISGRNLYRLKQIDIDGNYEYSNAIEVNIAEPLEYKLNQNYPNPFNPSTTISFSLPSESMVKVKIYNSIGQLVTTLLNSNLSSGNYKIEWNAREQSSGIYILTFEAYSNNGNSKFVNSSKLILIK